MGSQKRQGRNRVVPGCGHPSGVFVVGNRHMIANSDKVKTTVVTPLSDGDEIVYGRLVLPRVNQRAREGLDR